jgi:hypothetical protein
LRCYYGYHLSLPIPPFHFPISPHSW